MGRALYFQVDFSGSMNERGKFDYLQQQLVINLPDIIKEGTEIKLVFFNENGELPPGLNWEFHHSDALVHALKDLKLHPNGGTPLIDSINSAILDINIPHSLQNPKILVCDDAEVV
jgi:hypothetical protein